MMLKKWRPSLHPATMPGVFVAFTATVPDTVGTTNIVIAAAPVPAAAAVATTAAVTITAAAVAAAAAAAAAAAIAAVVTITAGTAATVTTATVCAGTAPIAAAITTVASATAALHLHGQTALEQALLVGLDVPRTVATGPDTASSSRIDPTEELNSYIDVYMVNIILIQT